MRALISWPGAFTYYQDTMLKILAADALRENPGSSPGTIIKIAKAGIDVACASGILRITKLKPQGKKEMVAHSFACGRRLKPQESFK